MASVSIIFSGQEEGVHELTSPKMVVGREPTCEIPIDNLGISRQHCAFVARGDTYVVQDLGSANGTYVNGKKIVEHFLNNDDEIVIGKYILKFSSVKKGVENVARDQSVVPDTLNTYVMDGSKIQEQLAKMRDSQEEKGSGAGVLPTANAGQGAPTAQDYAQAMNSAAGPQTASNQGLNKLVLIAAGFVIILLVIVILWLAFFNV